MHFRRVLNDGERERGNAPPDATTKKTKKKKKNKESSQNLLSSREPRHQKRTRTTRVCVCVCLPLQSRRDTLRYNTRETEKGDDAPKDILLLTRLRRRAVGIPIECTNAERRLWCATCRLSPQEYLSHEKTKIFSDKPLLKP